MRRPMSIVLLALLMVSALAVDGLAGTYYVNAKTGKDAPDWGLTAKKPFKTVGYALAQNDANIEIQIAAGTYAEPLTISQYRVVTLNGAGKSNTILKGDGAKPVLWIDGPTRVNLAKLSLQNGTHGIWSRMASIVCSGILISKNVGHGLYARANSFLSLTASSVSKNGGYGVRVHSGSTGEIVDCTINANEYCGIQVSYNSYAFIGTSTISANKQCGVELFSGSSAWIQHNEIFANTYDGVGITGQSMASFGGGNDIHANADNSGWRGGVGVRNGSQAHFTPQPGENKDAIFANNGLGIHVFNNSGMLLPSASIHNNTGNGITLGLLASGQFDTGAEIDNNGLYGVGCGGGAFVWGTVGSISGNGSGATTCQGWTPIPTSSLEELQEWPAAQ